MYLKAFIATLKRCLSKENPDFEVDVYISRRGEYVHMGLYIALQKREMHYGIVSFIERTR